ncbi:glycine oxidase ThiO [Terribacillus saccharophilus]|uniref:glycine oxidase n=1 Tax=Terribacillus saccharophilus TaxID=361277 RepID=A0ABX4GUF2_9BACI|nr:glycine oxidase ThiO [Terribacillus saccharophilus]PAD34027.1 glycine oxidase ThiO [Terribacillus saccharophilus]PAD94728.1 glycine oxidase ThiO [Terribacillus saccharophilus]PAD98500.1 glycine oxidase ThiO [Terribacillus saccharophilus]
MKRFSEVAIVGGGIIGSAIAYYLAKAGHQVDLLEAGQVGSGSTQAAAGMLGAHSEYKEFGASLYPFARTSQRLYEQAEADIRSLTGIDMERRTGGLLQLVYTEGDTIMSPLASLEGVTWLDRATVLKKVPGLSESVSGAVHMAEDVHVTPAIACKGFHTAARMLGAQTNTYTRVDEIVKESGRYRLRTSKGEWQADRVVVASGVWSNALLQRSGLGMPIFPVKGECIVVTNTQTPLTCSLFHDQHYIVPRNNNELVIGATKVKNDWSTEPTLGGLQTVMEKARKMLPNVDKMPFRRSWAGLRPQTSDGKPLIGEHPEMKGLYIAAGHQRNGILLAPATGKMICDLIGNNVVPEEWKEAFRVDRLNTGEEVLM